jgi:hypothetical protein
MSGDISVSTSVSTVPALTRARVTYLDGLRGVAALVVLSGHLALVFSPALVLGYSVPHQPAIQYWFATTPIVDLLVSGDVVVVGHVIGAACLLVAVVTLPPLRTRMAAAERTEPARNMSPGSAFW